MDQRPAVIAALLVIAGQAHEYGDTRRVGARRPLSPDWWRRDRCTVAALSRTIGRGTMWPLTSPITSSGWLLQQVGFDVYPVGFGLGGSAGDVFRKVVPPSLRSEDVELAVNNAPSVRVETFHKAIGHRL